MTSEYSHYKGMCFSPFSTSVETLTFVENEFQVLDDDIFNVVYPKSGTSWMIEILSLIISGGNPHWSRTVPNWERVPWMEILNMPEKLQTVSERPRLISSHLPFHLFPKSFSSSKAKVIYTVRHPKDVLTSYYHFSTMTVYCKKPESFEQLLQDFLTGDVIYGSWFDHIRGWTSMKDQSRFLLVTYEDLLKDLRGSVVRICKFLGRELDEAAIDSVVENATFKIMKDNKMANFSLMPDELMDQKKSPFMRKGISGDWKNHFTVEQSERFDRVYWQKMKGLDVKFSWDEE
ncbi:sulfotransferase family cytosolic 2B member 1-like [Rhinatrema bivittatum]|uniref:sulfotransferase family cytosolic 2B member 1-like n=1 Tax=Rhinatrema bivittatum TaxID=194408 RepID=UPI001126259C|nr:sulfotransferase family cytosolic 2B member 1-like [Rhinatrema bivittatum]XP_029440264.1 sulfotransferase family cytosolic 2B member 1-like [Rhinatrema bivittatum]XP_029440265.1 sulfotransferase family cytosolic 2B member 1-like [Rhinatrema bivittatum]